MAQYLLSAHSYVRETAGHAVFLDLKRDKYTALQSDDVRILRRVVRGWPAQEDQEQANSAPSSELDTAETLIRTLLREGLLTTDESTGKDAAPVAVEPVSATIDDVRGAYPSITWQDFRNFVRAWAWVTLLLRVLPLSWVISRVQDRKARLRPSSEQFDAQKAHRLMTAYWILRPNFFEARDACLRDSLTFVEFLAYYGVYPTLVFGVKTDPFGAHAWVQEGPMVLNDYIPIVTRFAPILAV